MTVSKKRRLGRGLEALLGPTTVPEAQNAGTLRQIPVHSIKPNPYQPRQTFSQAAIDELASSMASSGLLQPVVLRKVAVGEYQLIAGERRWRAAMQLEWKEIGAVIRDADDRTLLTLALIENLQRDALSAIDEATGYKRLMEDHELSHAEIAQLVGKNRSTIANALRLLNLPSSVQEMVQRGDLQMGHARALLQIADPKEIERIARTVVKLGLSVREAEARARGTRSAHRKVRPRSAHGTNDLSPETRRVEDALRTYLQTDVSITQSVSGKGRLAIDFYSNDDLARVLELVLGRPFDG
jgi:ParB family chromosome partitioning protein